MQWKRALDPQSDMIFRSIPNHGKIQKVPKNDLKFRKDLYQIVNVPKKTTIVKLKKERLEDMC